ncbi:MAG: phenylpyruvate tautomerase MIF-related protein [Desulfatibacillaceae bacterium]
MPFFRIQTNREMEDRAKEEFFTRATVFVASTLGKPEKVVMVELDTGRDMSFAGTTEPAAYVELKSIGLPAVSLNDYATRIFKFLQEELAVPPDRVFVDFADLPRERFAWNGKTFG